MGLDHEARQRMDSNIEQACTFHYGERIMETRSGTGRVGAVQDRLLGMPFDLVPVAFDDNPDLIVGVEPADLIRNP